MIYTKDQRQALSECFRETRDVMRRYPPWLGGSRYICDNIWYFGTTRGRWYDSRKIITDRIGGRISVEHWLRDEGYISKDFAFAARDHHTFDCKQMHLHRLRWLRSLVAEFRADPPTYKEESK